MGINQQPDADQKEFLERVVTINRVTKVVKGGRRFSFSALVVAGDGKGQVGKGTGKANEVPESIRKAARVAKKSFIKVPIKDQRTISHAITGKFGASIVVLKPATPGTGVIAGGPVRAVLECIGVKDILTKRLGSRNPHNVINATLNGLNQLVQLEQIKRSFNMHKRSRKKEDVPAQKTKPENVPAQKTKQEDVPAQKTKQENVLAQKTKPEDKA